MKTQSTIRKSPKPSLRRFVLLALLLLAGCASRPLKGGRALTTPTPGGRLAQTLSQGDNPSQPSTQTQETLRLRTYTLPAGSQFELPTPDAPLSEAPGSVVPNRNSKFKNQKSFLSSPMPVTEREETRATTQLGAAQKDTARELGAKLSSLRSIVWVGLGLFLFGLGTIFYAPLRALIGSLTTSLAITLGGLALMILPTLIVGNELLILGGVAVAVGGWFLAHRHGQLRGQVAALTPATSAPRPS